MKTKIAFILLGFLTISIVVGIEPTPAKGPAKPPLSPVRRAAIEELLRLKKVDLCYTQMMEQEKQKLMGKTARVLEPYGNPLQFQELAKTTEAEMLDIAAKTCGWDAVKNEMIEVYAAQLTDEEIQSLTAFYNTPAGQSYANKEVVLVMKMAEVGQKKIMTTLPQMQKIMADFVAKVKAAGLPRKTP